MFKNLEMKEIMEVNGGDLKDIPGAVVKAFKGAADAVTSDSFKKAFTGTMKITGAACSVIVNPLSVERAAYNADKGWEMIKNAGGY